MCLLIKKEGIFTSLQGLGDLGSQRYGINPRGAMDRAAARILNTLVGNDQDDTVLELHFPAGEIVFHEDSCFAVGGADFDAELDGVPVSAWQTLAARTSQKLRFRNRITGTRSYLTVRGGLSVADPYKDPAGSGLLTDRFETTRLRTGTRVLRSREAPGYVEPRTARVSTKLIPPYSRSPIVRVIPGGEFELLHADARNMLTSATFGLRSESNRMGYRLSGPALFHDPPIEIVSSAVAFGTIQLLPDGQLVILMADHQTSGGYPRLGNVISSDLPLLAQLSAGDTLSFQFTDPLTAEHAAAAFDLDLRWLKTGVELGRCR